MTHRLDPTPPPVVRDQAGRVVGTLNRIEYRDGTPVEVEINLDPMFIRITGADVIGPDSALAGVVSGVAFADATMTTVRCITLSAKDAQ